MNRKRRAAMVQKRDKSDKIWRIRIVFPDVKDFPNLARIGQLDWGGRGPRRQKDGQIIGEAYVTPQQLAALKKIKGCKLEVIEDAIEVGKKRQREVGKGDRFEGGKKAPRGIGRKE
jgi:hypothetical protein